MPYNSSDYLISECLDYCPHSGILRWKTRPLSHFSTTRSCSRSNSQFAGKQAGSLMGRGYLSVKISGSVYYAHRLAWFISNGQWPSKHIDHINNIKTDNRLENLREATNSENRQNTRLQKNNASGIKGVYFKKDSNKWEPQIRAGGKLMSLGLFVSMNDAEAAMIAARSQYHGEFANHG